MCVCEGNLNRLDIQAKSLSVLRVVIILWLSFLERLYVLEMYNEIFVDEIMSKICF